MQSKRKGFTLIELLVVVLIIGILAAVAVPQYKKAVTKSRLAEVATSLNTLQKDYEIYLLNKGGWPHYYVSFMVDEQANLEVPLSCATQNGILCYTNLGGWGFFCDDSSEDYCEIYLNTNFKADTTSTNTWLKGSVLHFHRKEGSKTWGLVTESVNSSVLPEVCTWWKTISPDHRVTTFGDAGPSDACDAYF